MGCNVLQRRKVLFGIPISAGLAHLCWSGPALAAESASASWSFAWLGELGLFAAKVFIVVGIPVAVLGIVLAKAGGRRGGSQVAAGLDGGRGFPFFGLKQPPAGTPKELLKVERLNDQLIAYNFSLQKAMAGAEAALAVSQQATFSKRFGSELAPSLTPIQLSDLAKAYEHWHGERTTAQQELDLLYSTAAISETDTTESSSNSSKLSQRIWAQTKHNPHRQLAKKAQAAVTRQVDADLKFMAKVTKMLTPEQRLVWQRLVKESPRALGIGLPGGLPERVDTAPKRVYVLRFFGGMQAKELKQLRHEVTAVLSAASAERGDEVVVLLNSRGGTVTGYGLAAAQLTRVKAKGLRLTICVEEVAASGGYMMACTADWLVASPFALLGSIGVISEHPNVHERLQREGIQWTTTTAGKYKRTLTPFKPVTEEDQAKAREDMEAVFALFTRFVKTNRPMVDLEQVATGETWFGQDALDRRLCDELRTSDDVLLERMTQGAELYSVSYKSPTPLEQLLSAATVADPEDWRARLAQHLLQSREAALAKVDEDPVL